MVAISVTEDEKKNACFYFREWTQQPKHGAWFWGLGFYIAPCFFFFQLHFIVNISHNDYANIILR